MSLNKSKRWIVFGIIYLALLAACTGQETASPVITAVPATPAIAVATQPAAEPTTAGVPVSSTASFPGQPLSFDKNNLFAAAGICTGCHATMQDSTGADVSIDRMWRPSMMANAARDPYWLAAVRSEVLGAPELRDIIEDKCASCHMPMAATPLHAKGSKAAVLDGGLLDQDTPDHGLALDGVSCNLCHQIDSENFGQPDSFSGHYLINLTKPMGERPSYGPFEVSPSNSQSMQASSGFIPLQSPHLGESEMCATCHELYTPYLDENGTIAGEFPEQTPYQEWLNSQYKAEITCQGCHMPQANGGVQLSILPGPKRSPFFQHNFYGGNAYMLRILRAFGEGIGVTASSNHYDDAILATEKLLTSATAELSLDGLRIEGDKLIGQISIKTLTGHKFPTSYPSRRAWLHVTVLDAAGNPVFESGAYNPDGSILGNANDADPTQFEPHYLILTSPDQVQIYEPIIGTTLRQVTTKLLRGAVYLKDNRLLPSGFDKAAANADIAVYGDALDDDNFQAGGDVLLLELPLGGAAGPFPMQVELLYQSIGYRWAQNLAEFQSASEVASFLGFYKAVANLPVVITLVKGEVK